MIDKVAEKLTDAQQRERVGAARIGSLAQKIGQRVDDVDKFPDSSTPVAQRIRQPALVPANLRSRQPLSDRESSSSNRVYRRVGVDTIDRVLDRHITEARSIS